MPSMVVLRRRTKSVKSTRQITKAMELVSASKMRKASSAALASRRYSEMAEELLQHVSSSTDMQQHPLYEAREVRHRLYIVITSNRGLSGAYNKTVLQAFAQELKAHQQSGVTHSAILIGKQAGRFVSRLQDLKVLGLYDKLPEKPTVADLSPLLSTAIDSFAPKRSGELPQADEVVVLYTRFVSNLEHTVHRQVLLPAGVVDSNSAVAVHTIFEPSPEEVLRVATRRLLEVQLLQAYLESQASEQSARMVAMKTASDNAKDLIDDLTLATNSLRQSTITRELAEISAGAGA